MSAVPLLASVPRRVAAYTLDIVLVFVGLLAVQALLFPVNPLLRSGLRSSVLLHAWVTLTVTAPLVVYFGLWWASRVGATPGMRLMRLRVRSADGGRVPLARALLRALVLLLPFELNHIVLFYPRAIWDDSSPGFRPGFLAVYALLAIYLGVTLRIPAHQGPHDFAGRTIVEQVSRAAV